jgi:hypothetical protein
VEPVRDQGEQRAIEETIRGEELIHNIEFW